jgi:hypothetical protein
MRLKPGMRAAAIHAPDGYLEEIRPLPDSVVLAETLSGSCDWLQVFVRTQADLEEVLPRAVAALAPDALLRLTFAKGTSGVQADLTRDRGWDSVRQTNLRWITLVSVDDTWSASALRLARPGEKPQTR